MYTSQQEQCKALKCDTSLRFKAVWLFANAGEINMHAECKCVCSQQVMFAFHFWVLISSQIIMRLQK